MELQNKWEHGPIALRSDENDMIQSFTSTILPVDGDAWRIWFSSHSNREKKYSFGFADGNFGTGFKKTELCISRGKKTVGLNILGIPEHWNLVQPVFIALPDGRERIYFWAHGSEEICRYLVADSDDKINFLVKDYRHPCIYHPNDRAVTKSTLKNVSLTIYCHEAHRASSPDEPEAPENMLANDATNVYMLPDGSFELYSAEVIPIDKKHRGFIAHDPSAGLLRVIQRRTSSDGIHWSAGQHVLEPDLNDPDALQFYYLSVTHSPFGRIGTLGYYRADSGSMDIEFCFSPNGIDWHRPCRGAGIQPMPGIVSLYAPHAMVEKNGRYHLFHTSYNFSHHGKLGPDSGNDKKSFIALSTIETDAFKPFWQALSMTTRKQPVATRCLGSFSDSESCQVRNFQSTARKGH